MPDPYLSEIRIMSFPFPPRGWALCNGQLLPINENQALFSLLGTMYGGDGLRTFALPDLRGRTPLHRGDGLRLGQRGGEERHSLIADELPAHSHKLVAANGAADAPVPASNLLASSPSALYGRAANLVAMAPGSVASAGSGQAHENRQPYLTLSFCIALEGIFPSPN